MDRSEIVSLLVLITLTCSCDSSKSQLPSTRNVGSQANISRTAIDYKVEDVDFEVRSVITKYVELAKIGKFEQIKDLIASNLVLEDFETNKRTLDPDEDSPNPIFAEDIARHNLEVSLPRMFFRVPLNAEQFIGKGSSDHSAQVVVVFTFAGHEAEKIAIDFGLKKEKKKWKIHSAVYITPPNSSLTGTQY